MSMDERADGRAITAVNIRKRSKQLEPEEQKQPISDDKLKRDHFMKADSDQIDLDALLQAVLDISDRLHHQEEKVVKAKGKPRPRSAYSNKSVDYYDPVDDGLSYASDLNTPSRKTHNRPCSAVSAGQPRPHEVKNLSFANSKVDEIDRENQRLLKKILRNKAKTSGQTGKTGPVKVKSSAEVNRSRLHQQIESENLAFLRRLEAVKPTKSLSKDHLMREHFKQTKYAKNVSRSGSRQSLGHSLGPKRSSSLTNLSSVDTRSEISVGSRHSSSSVKSDRVRCSSARSSFHCPRKEISAVWEAGW